MCKTSIGAGISIFIIIIKGATEDASGGASENIPHPGC
jgi:hypothetical protein